MIKSYLINGLFSDLLTSFREGTRRIRVDVSQTGFWDGREFRLNEPIPTAGKVLRITAPINFILQLQLLFSNSGEITMLAYRSDQGTAGGTWAPSLYYVANNQMTDTPSYTPAVTVHAGGTFVPSNPLAYKDKLTAKTSGATAQAATVGSGAVKERGLPPATYYLVFSGGGEGDYDLLLEERP